MKQPGSSGLGKRVAETIPRLGRGIALGYFTFVLLALLFVSPWLDFSMKRERGAPNGLFLFVVSSVYARKLFAFQELKGCTTTCGDVAHLICKA